MTPEGKVKALCKRVLTSHNVWYYMPVQNGMGVIGIPDFICCWKGRFLAVECKAPGKISSTTPNQKNRISEINDHGGTAIVVDSALQLERFLMERS